MKKVFLFTLLLLTALAADAQQPFAGLRESPYAGVFQATANPAYLISSKRPWDASLFVTNVGFGNNAIKLNLNLSDNFNDFTRVDPKNPLLTKNAIDGKINVDVLGPAFFMKINDRHAVGFFSRIRVLGDIRGLDAKLLQSYIEDANPDKLDLIGNNYTFTLNNQEVALNAFGEIGFSWAGELYFDGHNAIKAGASIKYIMGAGNLYAGFRDVGTATLTSNIADKKVKLQIASDNAKVEVVNGGNNFVNFDDFNAGKLLKSDATTVGLDLGVTYEYRLDGCRNCRNKPHDLKLGLAIMDIGRIQYTANKESFKYTKTNPGSIDVPIQDLSEETLSKVFTKHTLANKKIKTSLPTTLNLSADYRVAGGFYLNAAGQISLTKKTDVYTVGYANEFSFTPRFDVNGFGAYLPISFNQVSGTNLGLGLRLGPLVVGSSTVLSNLVTKSGKEANFFVGLRFGHMSYPTK